MIRHMAEISERLMVIREPLQRSRRELAQMPDVFTATAELAQAIGEISQVAELIERHVVSSGI